MSAGDHEDTLAVRAGATAASGHLAEVLVDTGATALCLPQSDRALPSAGPGGPGLPLAREAFAETATGIAPVRIFEPAHVDRMGREGAFECVELPEGAAPLLEVCARKRARMATCESKLAP